MSMLDHGELPSDILITPLDGGCFDDAVTALLAERHPVILDSSGNDLDRGRWRFAMADPFQVLTAEPDGRCVLDGVDQTAPVFEVLKQQLARFTVSPHRDLPPFMGGAAGIIGYEMGGVLEDLPSPKAAPNTPSFMLGFYDVVLAEDRMTGAISVLSNGFPEQEPAVRRTRAEARSQWLIDVVTEPASRQAIDAKVRWRVAQPKMDVCAAIERARQHIAEGDIFQANITQAFKAICPEEVTASDLYWRMRQHVDAPFSAYVDAGTYQVLSASPERFLQIDARGCVETRPIKGTRPRGATAEADAALKEELAQSEKERAENLMIVDLLRNDLSRCCQPGSVTTPKLHNVESFPNVHHLVSVVTGQLEDGFTAVDQFAAAFPGGSITGAPKIRAMEIIHDLEPIPRGAYCGSVVAFGFDGSLQSSIVIRTVVVQDDELILQAGGGIVWDSNPAAEYEEALVKAHPLMTLFGVFDG